jgi:hypothetical protein
MSTREQTSDIPNNPGDDSIADADEIENIDQQASISVRGKGLIYDFKIRIDAEELDEELNCKRNKDGFINQIEFENNIWKYQYQRDTTEGLKIYYKCSPITHKCQSMLYLINVSDKIKIYLSHIDHTHETKAIRGIKPHIKEAINKLYDLGTKLPRNILRALAKDGIEQPTRMQLSNHLNLYKKKKSQFDSNHINVAELEAWCQNISEIPEDLDQAFCAKFEKRIHSDQLNFFRRRLLESAQKANHVHADATYKLISEGFPVILIGTTDRQKRFHPLGLSITYNEKGDDFAFGFNSIKESAAKINDFEYKPNILIADGAEAISNGFNDAFPSFEKRVMCFAHVIRNIDSQLNRFITPTQKKVKYHLRKEILLLQLCESEPIFDKACELFLNKWRRINSVLINNFLAYFEDQWLRGLKGWFEGFAHGVPSQNNANEAWNRVIKEESKKLKLKLYKNKLRMLKL